MADDLKRVEFSMDDSVGGRPMSPSNVDLPNLRAFLDEVEALIKGDAARLNLANSRVELQPGSLKIVAFIAAAAAFDLQSDMGKLAATGDLDQIQSKRASIISRWQARAQKSPTRRYSILPMDPSKQVRIAGAQNVYLHHSENAWVEVEKFLTGTVENAGGRQDPNIHLFLPDTGVVLTISASKEQLREQKENQLYKLATLHVRAEQHMVNKSLRNIFLLGFVKTPVAVDENLLQALWRQGSEAWKDVPSAVDWVENIRGNQ